MTSNIFHVSLFFVVFSGIQICESCVYFKENCNVVMQVDNSFKVDKKHHRNLDFYDMCMQYILKNSTTMP